MRYCVEKRHPATMLSGVRRLGESDHQRCAVSSGAPSSAPAISPSGDDPSAPGRIGLRRPDTEHLVQAGQRVRDDGTVGGIEPFCGLFVYCFSPYWIPQTLGAISSELVAHQAYGHGSAGSRVMRWAKSRAASSSSPSQ